MSWFPWLDGFDVPGDKSPGDILEDAVLMAIPGTGATIKTLKDGKKKWDDRNAADAAIKMSVDAINDANALYNTNADGTSKLVNPPGAPAQSDSYADAPANGTTADAPKVLGYEDYPGELPPSKVTRYVAGQQWTEWADMSKEEKIKAKETLYAAGYYGKTDVPVMNGRVTAADRDALGLAMGDANIDESGDWSLTATANAAEADSGPIQDAKALARKRAAARATAIKTLDAYAYDNGIKLPSDFVAKKANQIAAGVKGVDEVTNQLTERFVARQYPALADDLKAGLSVREAAAPYISTYAQLLEVPDSQVDLNDPLLKKALQGVNDKGEPAYTPMWKFEEQLKQDKRWQYTNNAWDEVGSKAMTLMQMFGMAP